MGEDRRRSIQALLDRSEKQLESISAAYSASLEAKEISTDLRIEIKNLCENLRSVLDYLAHEIREAFPVTQVGAGRFYFPILPDEAGFVGQMGSWFPGLEKEAPELFGLLRSFQPYAGAPWLASFNRLNNENKHGDLVPQTRLETKTVEVKAPGGGSVSWNPATVKFGKGVYMHGVPIDPPTQMPVPNRKVQTTVTTWVDFRFKDIDESALGLLRQCVAGVAKLAKALLALL